MKLCRPDQRRSRAVQLHLYSSPSRQCLYAPCPTASASPDVSQPEAPAPVAPIAFPGVTQAGSRLHNQNSRRRQENSRLGRNGNLMIFAANFSALLGHRIGNSRHIEAEFALDRPLNGKMGILKGLVLESGSQLTASTSVSHLVRACTSHGSVSDLLPPVPVPPREHRSPP